MKLLRTQKPAAKNGKKLSDGLNNADLICRFNHESSLWSFHDGRKRSTGCCRLEELEVTSITELLFKIFTRFVGELSRVRV